MFILTSDSADREQWTFLILRAIRRQSEDAWIDGSLLEGGHIEHHQIVGLLIDDVRRLSIVHLPVEIILQTLLIPHLILDGARGIVSDEFRVRQPIRSNNAATLL